MLLPGYVERRMQLYHMVVNMCGANWMFHLLLKCSLALVQAGRHRRGSDWDQYNPNYDIVASYQSRKKDVVNYPQHRAYIWGKKFGISKVYAHFGAGGFAGASNNGQKYKVSHSVEYVLSRCMHST